MKQVLIKMRGFGYVVWQTRHMGYHILIGLVWAWFLRERWNEFNPKWIWAAVIGSLLPDIDHLFYFFTYGKHDTYSKQVFDYIKTSQWRNLFHFLSTGHKFNTSLSYHNIYVMALLLLGAVFASLYDWRAGVVLMGAMSSHYIFDMLDDILLLGTINPNWKRWGRPKKNRTLT